MKFEDLLNEDGRIVKGVNTTVDVDVDEIPRQAEKFGNKVDRNGFPPVLKSKERGSSTNVLSNLGIVGNGVYETEEPRYTAREWAIMEGGHCLEEPEQKPKLFDFDKY